MIDMKQDSLEGYAIGQNALIAARAAQHAAESFHESKFISITKYDELPRFDDDEIKLGGLLGKGGFSDVYEIKGFDDLRRSTRINLITNDMKDSLRISYGQAKIPDKEFKHKQFIAKHCLREKSGNARYAIKFLSKKTISGDIFCDGAADLVGEAYLLSNISHPNIIKIRGISGSGVDGFANPSGKAYFIIMDRLYDTLENRIKTWALKQKKDKWLLHHKITDKKNKNLFLAHRLNAAFDIAGALLHLHENNIIYRDLKPDNIGFDVRGDVKIFDFGLAKELQQDEMNADETYQLSINTGTRRYMAPEVAKGLPYNKFVDNYSFGVLLYQMCSLKKPWKKYTFEKHEELVIYGKKRPNVNKSLPALVQMLIKTSWHDSWEERQDFGFIVEVLKKEIGRLKKSDGYGLDHKKRRSTFIFSSDKTLNNSSHSNHSKHEVSKSLRNIFT